MSRRDRIERNRHVDIAAGAVDMMRQTAEVGLGFNCAFVDDDMRVMVGLAQRAVLAGLASDLSDDMQMRMVRASEPHRAGHEASLGRAIQKI